MPTQSDNPEKRERVRISNIIGDSTKKEREYLLRIGRDASNFPLLYGEPCEVRGEIIVPEMRMELIQYFLTRKTSEHRIIRVGGVIAGYASIWDGWLPIDMEYQDPEVEIAFIHPKYDDKKDRVKRVLNRILEDIAAEW